jgi:hypothetical protein
LLWENAEVLYARKAEWPVERLEKNLTRLREIILHVPNAKEIRTNEPVDVLADRALADIASILGRKQ